MKNKRLTGYSVNSKILVVGAVVVVLLINTLLTAFDNKISLKLNFVRDEIYTLTEETKDIVEKIDEETKIVILTNGEESEDLTLLRDIVEKYTKLNGNIVKEEVDFINNPMGLTSYSEAIRSIKNPYFAMLFVQGDKFETAEASSYISTEGQSNIERIITNKLATFADGFKISEVLLTTGHGEKTNTGFESVLEMYNYNVRSIDLMQEDLPQDNKTLLVINAPTGDFSAEEIDKLDHYLGRGGNVQIYFDPLLSDDTLPRLEEYLQNDWSLIRNHNVAVDMKNRLDSSSETAAKYGIMSVAELSDNDIVKPIQTGKRSVLYSASNTISVAPDKSDSVTVSPLLSTDSGAYMKSVEQLGDAKQAHDASGTFYICVTAEKKNYTLNEEIFTGKLLVSGSSYTMDTLIGDSRYANEDLLLNSINWMRGSEAGITVRAKDLPQGTLTVPNGHFWPWFILLVVVVPLAVIVCGTVVWAKRRFK